MKTNEIKNQEGEEGEGEEIETPDEDLKIPEFEEEALV